MPTVNNHDSLTHISKKKKKNDEKNNSTFLLLALIKCMKIRDDNKI